MEDQEKRPDVDDGAQIPKEHVPTSHDSETKNGPFGFDGDRVVLLVTAPLGNSFHSIRAAVGYNPPKIPTVDWDSHDTSAFPDLESRMKFTTHYAVCVIDSNVWDDSSLKLKDKFAQGRFWDHPGESNFLAPSQSSVIGSKRANPPVKNDGVPWEYDCIETIDSGQVIGQTNMSDREISAVYRELRQDWQYMPVFWNCHDLAIRLTHLVITPSKDAVTFLRNLMYSLVRAYNKEVGWFEIRCWFGLGGWCTAVAGGIACFPPMSAVGGAVFMAGWATGFVGTFVNDAKVKKKFAYMRKLEERFPVLKSLHPDSE